MSVEEWKDTVRRYVPYRSSDPIEVGPEMYAKLLDYAHDREFNLGVEEWPRSERLYYRGIAVVCRLPPMIGEGI